ncbi:hypothetical protein BRC60_02945 [Halobacteriales archaeon QH_1_68_42]|nr:MAG: hypothetical protein BRC60_02945 [Halobacteriales archaeon QH_1_68_42]
MTTVRLEGVSKRFGDLVACTDIDLTIRDGEFFVLLGPSGCGKSTTLRMIAGLETVSDGDIYFDDEMVTGTEPAERDVAMVFQNYALYPHKTVHQNIAFPLELMRRNIDDEEIERRVQETAELLQITDQLEKKPKNLSGGQQQRVALGRSIIREPSVFLMDEPLSNLDAKLRIRMRSELKQLHERLGVTTVYVTHDQEEAMSLADRIGLLNDGRVQQRLQRRLRVPRRRGGHRGDPRARHRSPAVLRRQADGPDDGRGGQSDDDHVVGPDRRTDRGAHPRDGDHRRHRDHRRDRQERRRRDQGHDRRVAPGEVLPLRRPGRTPVRLRDAQGPRVRGW